MSSPIDLTELLNRVDNDRELLIELFNIFKSEFPSHLQFLTAAIAGGEIKRVESESHILKGMLLNLSASTAASLAADIERLAREQKLDEVRLTFKALEKEALVLLARMNECLVEFQL